MIKKIIFAFLLGMIIFPAQAAYIPIGGTNGDIQYNNNGSFSGLSVIPPSKGGTGLSVLGTANQCLTTNGSASGMTWQNCSSGGGTMAIGSEITSSTSGSVLFVNAAGQLDQNNAKFFWNNTSGYLGLGTSLPNSILHIRDTNVNLLTIENTNATSYSRLRFTGSSISFTSGVGNSSATITGLQNKFYIYDITNSVPRMVIDSSGNIGLGTTSPSSKLHVAGELTVDTPLSTSNGGTGGTGTIRAATVNDTLVLGDAGNLVTIGSTATISETIPPSSSVNFPLLTQINVLAIGTTTSTIQAGSGVTLRFQDSSVTYVTFMYRYGIATLIKIGTDEWKVAGEIE